MRIREPWPTARSKQRRREFASVFAGVPLGSLGDMLEVGSGDGFMASLLAPYGKSLVTTEPSAGVAAHAPELPRLRCSVTALPFADRSFDFIFSSSVLEHVRDREAAFAELKRCLRPGGLMIHLMPSPTWKLLQLAFFYPHLTVRGLELIGAERQLPAAAPAPSTEDWRRHAPKPPLWQRVKRDGVPHVHGEYSGHLRELFGFRATVWARLFERTDFTVHARLPLPLYSGYGFGFERLRWVGERCGLSAHTAFVVTHHDERPDLLRHWAS